MNRNTLSVYTAFIDFCRMLPCWPILTNHQETWNQIVWAPMNQLKLIIYHCITGRNLTFLSKTWASRGSFLLSLPILKCKFHGEGNCFLLFNKQVNGSYLSFSFQLRYSFHKAVSWSWPPPPLRIFFGLHPIGQNLVTWPHLTAREETGPLFWETLCPVKKQRFYY